MKKEDIKVEIVYLTKKHKRDLQRLKTAYLLAKEFDYVPSRTVEDMEQIGKQFGIFETDILDEYQGLRPDEVVDRMITVINKF